MKGSVSPADRLQRQIVEEMKSDIKNGSLRTGVKLPSEKELSDKYMATRFVVRRALRQLEEEQLIEAVQGVGRFVRSQPRKIDVRRSVQLPIDTQSIDGYSADVKSIHLQNWPDQLTTKFALRADEKAIRVTRVFLVHDYPLMLERVYLPRDRFPSFKERLSSHNNSISNTLYNYGVKKYFRVSYNLSARAAEASERRILECPTYTPVLDVRSACVDDEGLVQYTESVGPSDRLEYSIHLSEQSAG